MTTEATPGNKRQRRPAWWRYVLAIVVFVPGPLLIVLSLVALFSACFGGTTKVIAPGESKITLPQSGTYTINYEYQTVVNGRRFDTSEVIPSALKLDLISTDSDTHIRIHEPSVHASYNVFGTKGKAMAEFTVDRPGTYVLISQYSSGETRTAVVLAVSQGSEGTAVLSVFGIIGGTLLLLVGIALAGWLIPDHLRDGRR